MNDASNRKPTSSTGASGATLGLAVLGGLVVALYGGLIWAIPHFDGHSFHR